MLAVSRKLEHYLMKQILVFLISTLLFTTISCGQKKVIAKKNLITLKYAGLFGYGSNFKKGTGQIIIYPETDTTVLFYIESNRGAPSYSNGSMYERIKIVNDTGTFSMKKDYQQVGCQWSFKFYANKLSIETINGRDECEFGYGVVADGNFKRKSNKILNSFVNMEGTRVYFKTTSPEKYNKE